MEPADVMRMVRVKIEGFFDDLFDHELMEEWSTAASALYKEQFAKKENPYGERWQYRPGDEKRKTSYYKFGAPSDIERDSFSLSVARSNPDRSCVPFEPRGLGRWRPKFEEIFFNRARARWSRVRP